MSQVRNFKDQYLAIFKNVFLLGYRSKELMAEAIFPFIVGCAMLVKNILLLLSFLAPIIVALSINGSTRALLIRLVEEKSGRLKEIQKIMGMKQKPYFLAWYSAALIRAFVSGFLFLVIPIALATKSGYAPEQYTKSGIQIAPSFLDQENYIGFWDLFYGGKVGQFILFFIIYCICAVNQSFMLSSLFSKTKLAGEVSTFLTTITTLLVFLVYWSKFETSKIGYYLISIFPQAGCAFAYVTAVRSPVYYTANVVVQDYFTLNEATYMMSGMAILYICLYFYFEQVMPNEFGISKHPLWFLKSKSQNLNNSSIIASGSRLSQGERKFNSSSINDTKNENSALLENQKLKVSLIGGDQQENLENVDTSSAIYHQPFDNVNNYQRTVEIKNMSKRFGSTKAVNRISLSLYEKNIFCLLGHNGAGKTTTISVLTGLIRKSGGSVKMYGMDLEDDLELIRKNLGICTQRDVVYEDLTFEEQLRFIARIKGIPEDQIQNEINIMLDKTKCHGEKGKLVKNLSGGNKRKLSLAMALIGGSKIVFLDEPTSGMDAISRRAIWDILETVREEERTIVLTTHHLDEAEVLADRIGIMAKGKLLAVGSTDYIKKNFGIGYHLSIFPDPQGVKLQFGDEIKEKVFQIVRSRLKSAVLNPQSRKDVMQFLVGFEDKERFGETFEEIEQIPGLMIGLEMNSLEDAFVNVGMDEEKFIQQSQNKVIVNIDKNQVNEEENQAKFTQFKDIKQPQCLSRPPNYSFQAQFTACFYRKYYCTVRTFTNYLAFIIPLVLLIAGAFIVQVLSSDLGNDQKIIVFGLFICIAYAFNGGIYIMLPVQERELHLKYALNVMGCRPLPYWLATFCFDYIIFSLTIISFMLVSLIGNVEYIKENAFGLALNLFCFGISFIPFSYMCGFMFKKGNSAMKIFPVLNFFVSYLVTFSVLGIIGLLFMESYINETVWKILSIPFTVLFLAFSPFYAMNWGVNLIPVYGSDYAQYSQGNYFYVISFNYLVYVAIMLAEGLLYIGITYYLEQQKYNLSAVNADQESLEELEPIEDQEVNREKQRILQLDVENNYATQGSQIGQAVEKVIVSNLWKRYDNGFIAIKDTNFGIKKGEILGLLGPNGAGKSTTFNILTSRIPRTLGSVKIKNIQVDKGIMEIYNDVGICPQFDCIWTNLTPVEHLYLFGRMKGLRGKDLDEAVEYFIKIMQLEDFRKTKAGNLSGGNKRKLCVSDALIGGPDIQFFDEPSTGVDPIARRFLWNTLQQGQKLRNSAIVLTTHTMDEAESLCTKIAIQINGRFQCLGSPAELRRKYGEGYTIIAKLMNDSTKGEFSSKLREQFQNIRILPDKKENVYNYRIPGKEFSFAKAFKFCEQAKKENLIEDFSINQSSLEEVFVYFSKFQVNVEQI